MSWTEREKALAAVVAIVIIIAAAVVLSITYRFGNIGSVKAVGIGVYWDRAGTQNVTQIDWGTVSPGSTYGVSVFIKNIKNTNITMSMMTGNWVPASASKYLALTWNYTGQVIRPGEIFPYQFRLAVASNITNVDTFGFDITITAIEYTGPS